MDWLISFDIRKRHHNGNVSKSPAARSRAGRPEEIIEGRSLHNTPLSAGPTVRFPMGGRVDSEYYVKGATPERPG